MIEAVLLLLGTGATAPAAAIAGASPAAAGQEVSVQVRLEVSEEGSVVQCAIVQTDALPQLADGVCPIMLENARFTPSVDQNGYPRRSTTTTTVKFVIQN